MPAWLQKLTRPFHSRKFRVALATVIASILVEYGLNVSEDVVYTILGMGAALILGIAHEDTARIAAQTNNLKPEAAN